MVEDDGSPQGELGNEHVEEMEPSEKLTDEDEIDRIDIELDRIRERRTNPESSFLVNTIVPRLSLIHI